MIKNNLIIFAAALAAALPLCGLAMGAVPSAAPLDLKTEALVKPVGLDTTAPRFSWRMETDRAGAKQAAWQVQVASSPDKLDAPDLWDSGWVESDSNVWNKYAGKPLQAFQQFFWRVRLREENGNVTDWSQPTRAEMGPFSSKDWRNAAWLKAPDYDVDTSEASEKFIRHAITQEGNREFGEKSLREIIRPLPLLRREFNLSFEPVRARAFLSAVGYADLRVNGESASDRVLDPAYTHYPDRRLFSTIDLTGKLKKGANALGISLGSGWAESFFQLRVQALKGIHYGHPEVRLLVLAEGANGEREWIATDDQWKMTEGPVRRSHLFVGEQFDARLLPDGWDKPGFDDAKWQTPPQGKPFTGVLASMQSPPERVISTMKPKSVREVAPGIWSVEFPEVATGWVRLKVKDAKAGETVILRPTLTRRGAPWVKVENQIKDKHLHYYDSLEKPVDGLAGFDNEFHILGKFEGNPQAQANRDKKASNPNLSTATATYAYTCKGGVEEWTPRFTYHPFRYVEVIGYPGAPTADSLTAEIVHSDLPRTGSLETGDPKLAALNEVFLRTAPYCLHGVLQDNPNVERGGWSEDARTLDWFALHFDTYHFTEKYLGDAATQITEDMPWHVTPSTSRGGGSENLDWKLSHSLIAWDNYMRYGDPETLKRFHATNTRMLDRIWRQTDGGTLDKITGLGDWQEPKHPGDEGKKAPWADRQSIVGGFTAIYTSIELSVGAFFVSAADTAVHTARLLGEDPAKWEQLRDTMRNRLREKFFKNGSFGTAAGNVLALEHNLVLNEAEAKQVAADLDRIIREEWDGHPGVGQTVLHSIATLLGQYGYADTAKQLYTIEGYPSFWSNLEPPRTTHGPGWKAHTIRQVQQTQARAGTWFTRGLAVIQPDSSHPGYRHFFLAAQFPSGHTSASATLMTAQGEIASAWKNEDDKIVWNVTVPWNTTATVKFPDGRSEEVAAGKHQFTLAGEAKTAR